MAKWLIAGSSGMVGRGIVRIAKSQGITDIVEVTSKTCDLRNLQKTRELLLDTKPDVVIDAAAKVGGILANSTEPVDFMINNLQIQTNLFSASNEANVRKVVFLSSSCVYPKLAEQPIKESSLLTGSLEETNSAYAVAKIAGMRLIQAYRQQYNRNWISVMPTNLFGTFDNFSTSTSHVLPALIRKFHDAKTKNESKVTLWGSLLLIVEKYDDAETINIGTGKDLSIKEISEIVKEVVGFQGEVTWDESKPDGTPRKLLDITKLRNLGYQPHEELKTGISKTYEWFKREIVSSKSDMRL
jgi:GDP-L-fucose synthase